MPATVLKSLEMLIQVDIEKNLTSRGRSFSLKTAFSSEEASRGACSALPGRARPFTLQSIAGLVTPDGGRISLKRPHPIRPCGGGVNIPPRHRGIGYVFQDYALFPHLTVMENIGFSLRKTWQWRLGGDGAAAGGRIPRNLRNRAPGGKPSPAIFRGGRSSAWPWPGHSSALPTFCSWTNPSPPWTRCCA